MYCGEAGVIEKIFNLIFSSIEIYYRKSLE